MVFIYVDDFRVVMTPIPLGYSFRPKTSKWVYSEELMVSEREINKTPESKTKEVLLIIMNNVCRDLKFTIESQEDFRNGYLPTLDTQLKLTPEGITYKFFEKESNTPFVTLETSAVSQQMNMQTLSQEVVRR